MYCLRTARVFSVWKSNNVYQAWSLASFPGLPPLPSGPKNKANIYQGSLAVCFSRHSSCTDNPSYEMPKPFLFFYCIICISNSAIWHCWLWSAQTLQCFSWTIYRCDYIGPVPMQTVINILACCIILGSTGHMTVTWLLTYGLTYMILHDPTYCPAHAARCNHKNISGN